MVIARARIGEFEQLWETFTTRGMAAAGLQGSPEPTFVESVGELPS